MHAMIGAAVLLAFVECGNRYKVQRDPGLTVSDDEEAYGHGGGIRYRVDAKGLNSHCCQIMVDILNVGGPAVSVRPRDAELSSPNCRVTIEFVEYLEGGDVRTFEDVRREAFTNFLSKGWLVVGEAPLILRSDSYLELLYVPGQFTKECAPYTFRLKIDENLTIRTTFTGPD
jgi:hypothetical protein